MNSIDIANGIVFQEMAVSKDTFEDRLICQKKVYLLQELGTDLGYRYNWYVRGPYSPSLTNYVYTNLDVLRSQDFSEFKLSQDAAKNIALVNSLVAKKKQELDIVGWYELLASLLYINNNRTSWQVSEGLDSLINTLIKYKPQYSTQQCEYAVSILNETGFMEVGV